MADNAISSISDECCTCWFSLSVAFDQWASHANFHEAVDIRQQWSTSRNHQSYSSSQSFFRFVENQWIVNHMSHSSVCGDIIHFNCQSSVQNHFSKTRNIFKLSFDHIIKSWKQPWNADEDSRFDECKVIFDFLNISRIINNGTSSVNYAVQKLSF